MGNPAADEAAYWRMLTYSPYDNVTGEIPTGRARVDPDLFVTAGLNDPRVAYWEPAKWVAKLRSRSPSTRVLLRTEMGAGHGGPSGRYDAWREEALVYAFLLDTLGLSAPPGLPRGRALASHPGRHPGVEVGVKVAVPDELVVPADPASRSAA